MTFFCRNNLTAWHGGDALVLAVAEQNNNTIVVVNSVGPLILEPWIDHPNVTAVRIHFCLYILPLNRFRLPFLEGRMGWTSWSRGWKFTG